MAPIMKDISGDSEITTNLLKLEPSKPAQDDARSDKDIHKTLTDVAKSMSGVIGYFSLAAAAAIGQHLFYSHVHGLEPSTYSIPQQWVVQIGTTLAASFQLAIAASIGLVFNEASWHCFQQEAISVKGINATFKLSSHANQLNCIAKLNYPFYLQSSSGPHNLRLFYPQAL